MLCSALGALESSAAVGASAAAAAGAPVRVTVVERDEHGCLCRSPVHTHSGGLPAASFWRQRPRRTKALGGAAGRAGGRNQ